MESCNHACMGLTANLYCVNVTECKILFTLSCEKYNSGTILQNIQVIIHSNKQITVWVYLNLESNGSESVYTILMVRKAQTFPI